MDRIMNSKPPTRTFAELDPEGRAASKLSAFALQVSMFFAAASILTYLLDDRLDLPFAIISAALFGGGILLLSLGFWNGIQRSRVDDVTLTGLLAIDKTHVPASARNKLWGAIVIQVVVSVLFASLRPFTQQAFGLLVPTVGLGIATLWGSRFAAFHDRGER
jgi:hypothetical protein